MTEQRKGIKETEELLSFILEIIRSINTSISDGITIFDTANFVKPALLASSAIKNITEVPSELKDLDENELKQLADVVLKQFENLDSKKEQIIKKSLDVIIKLVDLYLTIKE
jgi:hypothetical protein